jgi:hypothetical protein
LNPFEISYPPAITLRSGHTIRPEAVNPRIAGNFVRHFLIEETPFIWVGEPYMMNRRLIAQSGTFAMPGMLNQPFEEILSGYPTPKNTLVKFILHCGHVRQKGLRELYRMNITYATLFPDLDGLARSLAYELEFHWGYDPRKQGSQS